MILWPFYGHVFDLTRHQFAFFFLNTDTDKKIYPPTHTDTIQQLIQGSVCLQYVKSPLWLFILFCITLLCCVFYCCPVSTGLSPDFSPLFLFFSSSFLPSERPPIGFGGGRRLCGIIMGSSWENCPWKGLSEKKGERKKRKIWSCFRSFSETFIRALLLFGGEQSHHSPAVHSVAGSLCHCQGFLSQGQWAGAHALERCSSFALPWADAQRW